MGNFLAGISTSYLDYIYNNIGDGIKEIFSYYTYAFTFGIIVSFTFFTFISSLITTLIQFRKSKDGKKSDFDTNSIKKYLKSKKSSKLESITILLILFAIFTLIISMSIKHHYTYNAIIYIEKSLDILAPKLNENERLKLRAEYRMINSYESFEKFNTEIILLAKEKNIKIPEFKIIVK